MERIHKYHIAKAVTNRSRCFSGPTSCTPTSVKQPPSPSLDHTHLIFPVVDEHGNYHHTVVAMVVPRFRYGENLKDRESERERERERERRAEMMKLTDC